MEGGIRINLSNRWLYSLIALTLILIVSVGVYAFVNPATGVGHTGNDIDGIDASKITGTLTTSQIGDNQITSAKISGVDWNKINKPSCSDGQVLKWSGGNWVCGNDVDTDTNTWVLGVSVYKKHNRCSGAGDLTTATTCSSAPCVDGDQTGYKSCGGIFSSCNTYRSSPNSCNNDGPVGYLMPL